MSTIVITCVADVWFPQSSVAVNVRVKVDSLSQAPGVDTSSNVTVVSVHRSEAVAISRVSTSEHSAV